MTLSMAVAWKPSHSRLYGADGVLIVHEHGHQNHGERKSNSRPHHHVIGEEQLKLGNQLFQLEHTWSARCCRRISALAAAAAAVVVGVVLAVVGGKWKTMWRVLFSFLSVVPCSNFSLSPPATRSVSRFPRGSRGCSPHSSTASRRP